MSDQWDGELLSIPEAARAARVGQDRVRDWVSSGLLLPAHTPGIKQKKIRRCDLLDFLAPKPETTGIN